MKHQISSWSPIASVDMRKSLTSLNFNFLIQEILSPISQSFEKFNLEDVCKTFPTWCFSNSNTCRGHPVFSLECKL